MTRGAVRYKLGAMQWISGILLTFLLLLSQASDPLLEKDRDDVLKWEDEIEQFEGLDRAETYPSDAVLFVGSSSIRLWETIAEDMRPYPVIQRGYGGAKLSDIAWFSRRIIYPHRFRALVFFVANDISGGEEDRTPQEVLDLFELLIRTVRQKYPQSPVFWVQVTPTRSRWEAWAKIQSANRLIRDFCDRSENLYFIETAPAFFGPELFREDQLHLNRRGYRLWSSLIKGRLDSVLQQEGDIPRN